MANKLKPKTYLDRDIKENKNFLFVSYSHKDRDTVYDILDGLYQKNSNYWYDVNLEPGDIWDRKVESILRDKDCLGILFFLSKFALTSKAVYEEILIYKSIKEKRPDFLFIPISLNGQEFSSYYSEVFNLVDAKNNSNIFKEIAVFNEVFDGDKMDVLFYDKDNESSTVDEIFKIFSKYNALQSYNYNIDFIKTKHITGKFDQDGNHYLKCGTYDIKDELDQLKQEPIIWKLVYQKDNIYYYVAEKCLDFVNRDEIDTKLREIFKTCYNFLHCVESVDLIDQKILEERKKAIGNSVPTEYADSKRMQPLRLFCVRGEDGEMVMYNANNAQINIGKLDINIGLRPMLCLNIDKATEGEEKHG